VAILVEAFTDNRNRTAADLRLAFGKRTAANLGEDRLASANLFEATRLWCGSTRSDLPKEALLRALPELEALGYELDSAGALVFADARP